VNGIEVIDNVVSRTAGGTLCQTGTFDRGDLAGGDAFVNW
jgi:hypothetical protein